jgi:hypothetical protein
VAEAKEFTLDAPVAPAGIVPGHLLDQDDDGCVDRRASGPVREGPVPGDQPAMPTHDGGRGDQPVRLERPGEEPDQGREFGPVEPVQARFRVLPAQDRVLVTEDQDLDIFGRARPGEQGQPFGRAAERAVQHA